MRNSLSCFQHGKNALDGVALEASFDNIGSPPRRWSHFFVESPGLHRFNMGSTQRLDREAT